MDGTYAPQSPDLSSFLSSPSKQQQPYNPNQPASYAPRSPTLPSFNTQQQLHAYPHPAQQQSFGNEFAEYGSVTSYMPPIPPLPASHSFAHNPTSTPYYTQQPLKSEPSFLSNPASYPSYDGAEDYPTMSRNPRIKDESAFAAAAAAPKYKDPNPHNIEIKTKFPVARIKRIMQADEEVGKVAQVTPVAVNKALELFMIALVGRAAEKAREKGGKRVTAQHLKMVVEGDEQFDFLGEIVGRVAEVTEGAGGEGRKRKEKVLESGSESEEKKPKKGKGRRKKSDD